MNFYSFLLRPILFLFPAEFVHRSTFGALKLMFRIPFVAFIFRKLYTNSSSQFSQKIWGLEFENPIGLAAGFDKNAELIDELACLGFGFIEIGTVTPRPQSGNEKPRLFRLKKDQAIVNRMGFNNDGVDKIVSRLKKRKSTIPIGGNIGKNKTTPNESATEDYVICFEKLFDWVDYFVVNVSSPNTPNLRALQEKEPLEQLLNTLQSLNLQKKQPKPILLKIAPDISESQLNEIIEVVQDTKIHGIIATNTTVSRENLRTDASMIQKIGAGGLSGVPLKNRSTEVIRYIAQKSEGKIPVIGVGGVCNADDVTEKMKAGARLVQVYTGLVYEGPSMVRNILRKIDINFLKNT